MLSSITNFNLSVMHHILGQPSFPLASGTSLGRFKVQVSRWGSNIIQSLLSLERQTPKVKRAQSSPSHTSVGTRYSVLSFLSFSFSLLYSLHNFPISLWLILLSLLSLAYQSEKPDDLHFPSFSLTQLSFLSLLCLLKYGRCGKHRSSHTDGW